MNPQRPLALLLSLAIAGQPVLVEAAGVAHGASFRPRDAAAPEPREISRDLQPLFKQLTASGRPDKATETEITALVGSIVESLPAETIEELAAVAAQIAGSRGDSAALDEARQMFTQTVDGLPEATRAEIQEFVTAGISLSSLSAAIVALQKFRQHQDNPGQVPIGTPIALIFVAAALLFLPSILGDEVIGPDQRRLCDDVCAAPVEAGPAPAARP